MWNKLIISSLMSAAFVTSVLTTTYFASGRFATKTDVMDIVSEKAPYVLDRSRINLEIETLREAQTQASSREVELRGEILSLRARVAMLENEKAAKAQ